MESSSTRTAQAAEVAEGSPKKAAPEAMPLVENEPTVITGRPPMATSDEAAVQTGPGTFLGHYQLIEPIGGGGMGRVFRALDTRLNRTVALKVLSRQQASDMETLLRFHNEARSAARLNHESIAQVYYVGEDQGLPFIASEFVEGSNIRDLVLRKGPLPLGEAISYTLQVAEALRHAVERNVVHRDVKPSNILVTPEGRAKLIDLGLAKLQSRDDSGSDLTASGVTLGTFDYISPEQARDPRLADVRSDIYSLGCTLFYMLAGRPPFPQGTVLQKLLQHQGDDPPDVRVFRPELPEEVTRLLRKMMAKDPQRRFRDPARLIVALLSLADEMGLRPVQSGGLVWAIPRQRRVSLLQRHLPWAAPVAVLMGIVFLLYVFSSPSDEPPPIIGPTGSATTDKPMGTDRALVADSNKREHQTPSPGSVKKDTAGSDDNPRPKAPLSRPPASAESEEGKDSMTPSGGAATRSPDSAAPPSVDRDASQANAQAAAGLRSGAIDGRFSTAQLAAAGFSSRGEFGLDWANGQAETVPAAADSQKELVPGEHRRWTVDPHEPNGADFATLGAACRAAADGDVIELRYDGHMEAEPIALANLDLTIEAGQGFQPVVAFEPTEVDPIKYPRSMFSLTGTRLTLTGLALELNVPREVPADSWTMFEMGRADQVWLQRCWLTIRNASGGAASGSARQALDAYHPDVAFFRLKTALGSEAVLGGGPAASRRAALRLEDSVVRGEASVLRIEDAQPVDLTWTNGLLATTEWLLVAGGLERTPSPAETIRLELTELTAMVGAGLCQLNRSQIAPNALVTKIDCSRCVFTTSDRNPSYVVEQTGVSDLLQASRDLDWHSQQSTFDGFQTLWRIRLLDPDSLPLDRAFDEWQSVGTPPEGESGDRLSAVPWKLTPPADVPVHAQTPADYAPAEALRLQSPAVGTDAAQIGLQAARLPSLPEDAHGESSSDDPAARDD